MSYDLYCYRPTSEAPSIEEARAIVEAEEVTSGESSEGAESKLLRETMVNALRTENPRLEVFPFDYDAIAKIRNISREEARAQMSYVELNPPEGDLASQLSVYADHVDITVPYWYTGEKSKAVFQQMNNYLRAVRTVAGFFVYDPQTDRAFDPEIEDFGEHGQYDRISEDLPRIAAKQVSKKPWWKFW